MESLFDCQSFVQFLEENERSPQHSRGFRRMLAEYAQCQPSYVTRVMNRQAYFSLEQAILITERLGLQSDQSQFLLLLLQRDRAGNALLKKHFTGEIEKIREQKSKIKAVLQLPAPTNAFSESEYYSSWIYIAAHVLVALPEFQNEKKLSKHLGVSDDKLRKVLRFLEETRTVVKTSEGHWKVGLNSFHLDSESPHIAKHHSNWRIKAIQSLDRPHAQDLHYSLCFGVSERDWSKIRNLLLKTIKDTMQIVSPSKEECAGVFNVDLFRL